MQCFLFSKMSNSAKEILVDMPSKTRLLEQEWCTKSCGKEHKRCRYQQYHITISFGYLDRHDTMNYTPDFMLNVKPLELYLPNIESG
jgi:hypothetical protein